MQILKLFLRGNCKTHLPFKIVLLSQFAFILLGQPIRGWSRRMNRGSTAATRNLAQNHRFFWAKQFCKSLLCLMFAMPLMADELSTVEHVEINRFEGKWYEIARFPNHFEKVCGLNVEATYTKNPDGTLAVVNRCQDKETNEIKEANGVAWIVDTHSHAKLKVTFVKVPFIKYFFAADYWIIDLAPDYSYAVVSDPTKKYLWILSRTPKLSDSTYESIIQKLEAMGFDTKKLVKTTHT